MGPQWITCYEHPKNSSMQETELVSLLHYTCLSYLLLALIQLTSTKWWASASASKWWMGFNSAFKGFNNSEFKAISLYSPLAVVFKLLNVKCRYACSGNFQNIYREVSHFWLFRCHIPRHHLI
jgi:hypothetical protein